MFVTLITANWCSHCQLELNFQVIGWDREGREGQVICRCECVVVAIQCLCNAFQ